MRIVTALTALVFALVLNSCDTTKKTLDMNEELLKSGNYVVKTINGEVPKTKAPKFTIDVEGSSFNGNSGCNSIFGAATISDKNIEFGNLASTEMYCDEEIMDTERAFFDALNNTGSYAIVRNNILVFYSKTDKRVLMEATEEILK